MPGGRRACDPSGRGLACRRVRQPSRTPVSPTVPGLDAGVYHYASRDHLLERRCTLDAAAASRLAAALPHGCLLIGLTSIHWREAWKYGERAFRYCQLDLGHAIAAVRYA